MALKELIEDIATYHDVPIAEIARDAGINREKLWYWMHKYEGSREWLNLINSLYKYSDLPPEKFLKKLQENC